MEVTLSVEMLLLALALAWGTTALERAVQTWERTRVFEATAHSMSELGGKLIEKLAPDGLFRAASPPNCPPTDGRRTD